MAKPWEKDEVIKGPWDNDDIVDQEAQASIEPNKETEGQTQFDKNGISGMLFPRATESKEKGGNIASRGLAALGDVLTIPQRAVAAGSSLAGYKFGGGDDAGAAQLAAQEFSRFKPTDDTKGVARIGQEVAYDPTLIPGMLTGATELKLASKAPSLVKAAIPAISGALQSGGSSAIRQATEGDVNVAKTAKDVGIGAAIPAAVSGVGLGLKKVAGETGKRLIQALIRPGQKGMKEGFDVDYIMKDQELLDAAGGGIESLQKTLQNKFTRLSDEVKNIQATAGQNVAIDVPSVYMRTVKKLKASNDFTGMKRELVDALDGLQDNLSNEIEQFDDYTDLATAMKLRTNYGTKINFQPSIAGGGRKAAMGASADEKVYDAFYKELSEEIKKKAPKEIAEIDKEYTKLIPVLKAANRRVLVETSNLPIGLMEGVGGVGVGAASALTGDGDFGERVKRGLVGAASGALITKGIKSPRTGAALYGLSDMTGVAPAVTTASPLNALLAQDKKEKEKRSRY